MGEDELLEGRKPTVRGLAQQQHLGAGFELPLPPVVRLDFGNEVRAGDEPGAESASSEGASQLQIGRSDEDDGE